jgi:hypothetical protein
MALDFPNTPVDGQVYDNFIYDAAKGTWKSLSSGASPNYLVNPTITDAVITATATTPSTVPITVNGAASQTANLQEWKNSAGIVLADVDNVGSLQAPKLGLGGAVPPTSPSSTHLQVNGRAKILSNGAESAGIWITGSNNVDTAFIGQTSTTTTDPVGIYHNGAWRFSVDSLGRVVRPFQPSFLARNNEFISSTRTIVFGEVLHNNGSHYNSSNGRFTAPVAGYYLFNFETLIYDMGTSSSCWFGLNGTSQYAFAGVYGQHSGTYAGQSASIIIYMNANDYAYITFLYSTTKLHSNYTIFSGHLLS